MTSTLETLCSSQSWRARSMNGVIGSSSVAIRRCMRAARTITFVADVSSSMSNAVAIQRSRLENEGWERVTTLAVPDEFGLASE